MPTDDDDTRSTADVVTLDPDRPRARRAKPRARQDEAQPGSGNGQERVRRRPGRPMKLSHEVVDGIVGALRTGISIRDAAQVVGVSEASVHRWRNEGEAALVVALDKLAIHADEDYDADDVLMVVPDDKRLFVEFFWGFTHADAVGVAELASRLQRTADPRVQLKLLGMRRPDRFRETIGVDANVVISESAVRQTIRDRLDRLGAIDTTGRDASELAEASAEDETERTTTKGARARQKAKQGAR